MPDFLVISLRGDQKLAVYQVDPDTAALQHRHDHDCGAQAGPLCYHPERRVLYAAMRGPTRFDALRLDPADGALSLLHSRAVDGSACFLGFDRSHRYLLSAYYHEGKVMVHPITADGGIGAAVVDRATAANAHSIQCDPANRHAYVPHIAGPNVIHQFHFAPATGDLAPLSPATVAPGDGQGPRHFAWHPSLPLLYFVNEQGGSVTTYHHQAASGSLSRGASVSTLPADFSGRNLCAEIRISADGRHLYASNRGHDSIACFAVDPDGGLTPIQRLGCPAHPRAFTLSADDRHLYCLGMDDGHLAPYRRDPADGRLTALPRIPVGQSPVWAEYIRDC